MKFTNEDAEENINQNLSTLKIKVTAICQGFLASGMLSCFWTAGLSQYQYTKMCMFYLQIG